MPWPFKRKTSSTELHAGERLEEARAARAKAEQDLQRVTDQWPEVRDTANQLNTQLEKNHFAERFRAALGG
jgi:uncharacterized protein (DUF3084 family)